MIVAGAIFLGAVSSLFAAWSYLAHLAIGPLEQASIEKALDALEREQYAVAKEIVGRLQERATPDEFGAALYVMGAVKAKEADEEFSLDRRRAMHLVAARYLQKARVLGVSNELEPKLQFLLGRSLILGNQAQQGIELLEATIDDPELPATEIDSLLASAYLETATPQLSKALSHLERVLRDETLSPAKRNRTVQQRADVLLRLGDPDRARPAVAAVGVIGADEGELASWSLLAGRLALLEASTKEEPDDRELEFDVADARLREAIQRDSAVGPTTRQAMYWLGRVYGARGQRDAAIDQFTRLAKIYGDSPEGLAAMLAAADEYRAQGEFDKAQASYRTLLELAPAPETYVNPIISLPALRKRLLIAQQHFVDAEQYDAAVAMLDQLPALFSVDELVNLRAQTHYKWGTALLDPLRDTDAWRRDEEQRQGRLHMRHAGRAFEALARLRADSREFNNDLWQAAESYFAGQSFTQSAQLYEEYLLHESRSRNGAALLRMGQSRLANGQFGQAVRALDECVELYGRSDVVYQARVEAARAHRELGHHEAAEDLLLTNLYGDALQTESPEWRESLFDLGRLYYDLARYDEAIRVLDEAVARYPDDDQALLANYTIARANHRASEEPGQRVQEAKTENERQKNRQMMTDYLERALDTYAKVQRAITLAGGGDHNALHRMLLRNCYMMRGAVLFDLRRFDEAREAYSGLSSLYQNDPFVLEIQVQIASCLRRLNEPVKARLAIVQAQQLLGSLPPNADFLASTNFSRQQWELLLDQMARW
ncbi:MAG: hypothetical protein CMJ58_24200 [Planctomycetaceae bacterium]|nr:hypothetical protein [Planctomycetaceae bacterium]